jgi:hypothetical protein
VNKSESIKNLATALHKAQGQIKHAVKDSKNPFFKSSYADLVSVWDAIRDAFQANGLSISQMPDMDGDKPVLTSILMHQSGEFLESRILLNPAKNDPQGIGSCVSYYRRYALQAIAGVCADDDDGEAAHGRTTKTDGATGETRTSIPKPNDKQLAAVGILNALIEQGGGEEGIRQREEQRKTYKYSEPAVQIRKRMDLCQALGLEPDDEQAATLKANGYPWSKA